MNRQNESPETISQSNVVASALLLSQRDLIEKLALRKQELTEQVAKLHAHLLW
jgi:Zn-dependent peptidase ImmA (M78 family)